MGAPTSHVLYELMYYALIDIRAEAHTCNNPIIYRLSDLVHALPKRLELMERGKESPEDVMQWLQARARDRGIEQWLQLRIQEAQRYAPREHSGSDT